MTDKVKPNKKQPKTIWEQVNDSDKDVFFLYMEKKVRNINKKLKEIQQLEEALAAQKELKPEQYEKINSKQSHLDKVAEWESIAQQWREAHKEDQSTRKTTQQVQQVNPTEKVVRQLLTAVRTKPEVRDLFTKPHNSTNELAVQITKELGADAAEEDGPHEGFQAQVVVTQVTAPVPEVQQVESVQAPVAEVPAPQPEVREEQPQVQPPAPAVAVQEPEQQYTIQRKTSGKHDDSNTDSPNGKRGNKGERGDRERGDRGDRGEKGERPQRQERGNRGERHERTEGQEEGGERPQREKGERHERGEKKERRDNRENRGDRNNRENRENRDNRGPRKPKKTEEENASPEEDDGFQTVEHKFQKPKFQGNRGGGERRGNGGGKRTGDRPDRADRGDRGGEQVQYVPKN